MNIYTVAKASQGLADYLKKNFTEPSVAIGYDSRIQFIQALLEANGLAAGKDHQFKGRYDAEKNAVIISLKNGE